MLALLVTVLAFLIMTAILAQSIHNIVEAGYGRRRVAAINAAEAGLNWYAGALETGSNSLLVKLSSTKDKWSRGNDGWYTRQSSQASGKPDLSTFELRVKYSKTNPCASSGNPSTCSAANLTSPLDLTKYIGPLAPPFPDPVYAVVRSIGIAGTATRVMEQYVRLHAQTAAVAGGLSAISLCLGAAAKVSVLGDLAINNQAIPASVKTVYKDAGCEVTGNTGNVVIDKGKYLRTMPATAGHGDLLIRGGGLSVVDTKHIEVGGNLEVEGQIALGCAGGTACVQPSSACVTTGTIQCVSGSASGTGIFQGPYAHITGVQTVCSPVPGCPPDTYFTEIWWTDPEGNRSATWKTWSPVEVSASQITAAQIAAPTSRTVLHVSGQNCDIAMPSGNVSLRTTVAIVSECRYKFSSNGMTLAPKAGCTDCALLVMSVLPQTAKSYTEVNCGTPSAWSSNSLGPRDIWVAGNQDFSNAGFFLYTPCFLWVSGNQCQGCPNDPNVDYSPNPGDTDGDKTLEGREQWIRGQLIARYMMLKAGIRLIQSDIGQYVPDIPGQVYRFTQDIKFVREISVAAALANAA